MKRFRIKEKYYCICIALITVCTQKTNLQTIFFGMVLTIILQGVNILIADLIVTHHLKTARQILRIVHCYDVSMSIISDPLFFYENNLWFLFRARIVTAI